MRLQSWALLLLLAVVLVVASGHAGLNVSGTLGNVARNVEHALGRPL
jgi:hypothetical protein